MVIEEKLMVATGGKHVALMMPPNVAHTVLLKLERLAGGSRGWGLYIFPSQNLSGGVLSPPSSHADVRSVSR